MIAIQDAANQAAALLRLRAVEAHAVDGATVESMVQGCYVLDVIEDGQTVGAVALKVSPDGGTATIRAAQASGTQTYAQLKVIETALKDKGVLTVGLFTKRPALIQRLQKQGYRVVACELQKVL